jgi:hypothetical protein
MKYTANTSRELIRRDYLYIYMRYVKEFVREAGRFDEMLTYPE